MTNWIGKSRVDLNWIGKSRVDLLDHQFWTLNFESEVIWLMLSQWRRDRWIHSLSEFHTTGIMICLRRLTARVFAEPANQYVEHSNVSSMPKLLCFVDGRMFSTALASSSSNWSGRLTSNSSLPCLLRLCGKRSLPKQWVSSWRASSDLFMFSHYVFL